MHSLTGSLTSPYPVLPAIKSTNGECLLAQVRAHNLSFAGNRRTSTGTCSWQLSIPDATTADEDGKAGAQPSDSEAVGEYKPGVEDPDGKTSEQQPETSTQESSNEKETSEMKPVDGTGKQTSNVDSSKNGNFTQQVAIKLPRLCVLLISTQPKTGCLTDLLFKSDLQVLRCERRCWCAC